MKKIILGTTLIIFSLEASAQIQKVQVKEDGQATMSVNDFTYNAGNIGIGGNPTSNSRLSIHSNSSGDLIDFNGNASSGYRYSIDSNHLSILDFSTLSTIWKIGSGELITPQKTKIGNESLTSGNAQLNVRANYPSVLSLQSSVIGSNEYLFQVDGNGLSLFNYSSMSTPLTIKNNNKIYIGSDYGEQDLNIFNGNGSLGLAGGSHGSIVFSQFGGTPNVVRGGNNGISFGIGTSDTEKGGGTFTEHMKIDNNGNVGIGTDNPSQSLTITDSFYTTLSLRSDEAAAGSTILLGDGSTASLAPRAIKADSNSLQFGKATNWEQLSGGAFSPSMTIKDDGNVGIGTDAPKQKMSITGNQSSLSVATDGSAGGSPSANILIGTYTDYSANSYLTPKVIKGDSNALRFGTGSNWADSEGGTFSEKMAILNSGNVGIGITSPAAKLNVATNGTIGGSNLGNSSILIGTTTSGLGIDNNEIVIKGNDLYLGPIDSGKDIRFRAGNSSTRMFLDGSNGHLGIGTTTPDAILDVQGQNAFFFSMTDQNTLSTGRNTGEKITLKTTDTHGYLDYVQDSDSNGSHVLYIRNLAQGTSSNNDIRLHTGGQDRLTVRTNGDVGIGTTDPKGFKLGVNGKIAAEEVKVALYANWWPDYVFEDNYNLPTLEEVENHISEKGHLEHIPSAKEVEKNGIFLGDMNAKLLRKIEELTLYTIAQEKQLKAQKIEIEKLKTEKNAVETLAKQLAEMQNQINALKK